MTHARPRLKLQALFHLPPYDVKSLQDERSAIWQLYQSGQIDDHQATVSLLRVGLALRRARTQPPVQPSSPPAFHFG